MRDGPILFIDKPPKFEDTGGVITLEVVSGGETLRFAMTANTAQHLCVNGSRILTDRFNKAVATTITKLPTAKPGRRRGAT